MVLLLLLLLLLLLFLLLLLLLLLLHLLQGAGWQRGGHGYKVGSGAIAGVHGIFKEKRNMEFSGKD
jgi:hypothetical protein